MYEEVCYHVSLLPLQVPSRDALKGTLGEEATCTEEVVQLREEQQSQGVQQAPSKQEPAQPTPLDTEMEEHVSPTFSAIF